MASAEAPAAGATTPSVQLDERDQILLARFIAAGGAHLFIYPDNEETRGKKGKKDRDRRRANRDARNLSAIATLEAGMTTRSEPTDAECIEAERVATLERTHQQMSLQSRIQFIQIMCAAVEYGSDAVAEMIQQTRKDTAAQADPIEKEASEDETMAEAAAAARAMARQRAQQRLQQQQQLDAERRRKLLRNAKPMTAAEAEATAEAEGLQLERCENATGFQGVRHGPTSAASHPFQAMHGSDSLGYFATAEEAALVYARRVAPQKAARAAKAALKAKEAAAKAEIRAQRRAEAEAEAVAKAVLRMSPPPKLDAKLSLAEHAAFAKEFNAAGAADCDSYCCQFNIYVGCQRGRCAFRHEVPPTFDRASWKVAFREQYWNTEDGFDRLLEDFYNDQIQFDRKQWPHAGSIECTYEGRRFPWIYFRCSSVQRTVLRPGARCTCENSPRCVTCQPPARDPSSCPEVCRPCQ